MRCFFDNTTDAWDFAMAMGASKEFNVTDYGYTYMGDDETGDQKPYVDIEESEEVKV